MSTPQSHTITALVQNESGTLNRLVSLFRRRAFSLASLNAGDCEEAGFSRVTMVVDGDRDMLRQCVRQLDKLVDVVEVEDLPQGESVQRELALVKVGDAQVAGFMAKQPFLSRIVHQDAHSLTVEILASPQELDALVKDLRPYNILQIVRSGLVAIRVGEASNS